jgi:hypothetical protein
VLQPGLLLFLLAGGQVLLLDLGAQLLYLGRFDR